MASKILFLFAVIALFAAGAAMGLPLRGGENSPSSYVGAVVQASMIHKDDPIATKMANLDFYEQQINKSVALGAQIIVFPENGLGVNHIVRSKNAAYAEDIPAADENINPCLQSEEWCSTRPALCRSSCLARQYRVTLVISFNDRKPCSSSDPCHNRDNQLIFNTACVFNEEGLLVVRYHKFHIVTPFPVFDVPSTPDIAYFDTAFGVRFGVFICFDILWPAPQETLLSMNISNFVFPTSWTNIPPFLLATEVQQGWSRAKHVSLLAANSGDSSSESGSGIWVRGEPAAVFFDPSLKGDSDNRLLIARININEEEKENEKDELHLPQLPVEKSNIVKDDNNEQLSLSACGTVGVNACHCKMFRAKPGSSDSISVSHNSLNCSLSYSISNQQQTKSNKNITDDDEEDDESEGEWHALIAFSGTAWFLQPLPIELCSLVKCVSRRWCAWPNVMQSAMRYSTLARFDRFDLSGTFGQATPSRKQEFEYPLLASNNGSTLSADLVQFSAADNRLASRWNESQPILAATILAREWDKDK